MVFLATSALLVSVSFFFLSLFSNFGTLQDMV
jgi:hypothetical protein